ncbi:MAG: LptF/LptG family permease [Chlamydiales bacterium]|nr:LptF/LptG family permease [Chlamydiales bacterium]
MPILWRYLLKSYLQVLALSVSSFIALLLVTRFQEIARFATSGAGILPVLLFTLYQIPYILPVAIPVACLIASMLLYQRLSHTHELTALRSTGFGLSPIIFPLLIAGSLLSLVNFSLASEIAPRCRVLSRELIYEVTAKNPLFLLQKETLVRMKDTYIDMKALKSGRQAEDVVFIANNASSKRLAMMVAKELVLEDEMFTGKNVSIISSVDPKGDDRFDHLIIENQKTMCTKASNFAQFVSSFEWHSNFDYYPLKSILISERIEKPEQRFLSGRAVIEITRRASLGLAAFTFTFIGVAFGMEIGRRESKKGLFWAIGLAALFMISFIAAKSFKDAPLIACLVYLLPHPLIVLASLRSLKRVSEGRE